MNDKTPELMVYKDGLLCTVARWRLATFLLLALLLIVSRYVDMTQLSMPYGERFIARVFISGTIKEDQIRDEILNKIKDNNKIAAIIVHIDSPGGTVVGGETLYTHLRDIASKKPVVAVMGTLATSGGYMSALAADYIIAHQGTITGSIGVMTGAVDLTGIMDKIGVKYTQIKSGELKNSLSPFEKLSDKGRQNMESMINDSYNYFVSLLQKHRSLSREDAIERSDGRLYTGNQALNASLVDQIGGEEEAIMWLERKKIKFQIKTLDLVPQKRGIDRVMNGLIDVSKLLSYLDINFSSATSG